MGPWAFLLKPTNLIILVLAVVAAVSSGAAYYFYNKNISLHEDLAVQKSANETFVSINNQQVAGLTKVITDQNAKIDQFRKAGESQAAAMGKVQSVVNELRVASEQQLAELRKKPVADYTCEQAIQSLITQSTLLNWGATK